MTNMTTLTRVLDEVAETASKHISVTARLGAHPLLAQIALKQRMLSDIDDNHSYLKDRFTGMFLTMQAQAAAERKIKAML